MVVADPTTPQSLEWTRLLTLAQQECRSLAARALIGRLTDPANWAPTLEAARLLQQETSEAMPLLDREALWGPLSGLEDPVALFESLAKPDFVLETSALVILRQWLYAIDSWARVPR